MGLCHQSKRISPPSHSETSRTQTLMIVPKEQPSELIALGVQSCQRCVQLDPRGCKMALQEQKPAPCLVPGHGPVTPE